MRRMIGFRCAPAIAIALWCGAAFATEVKVHEGEWEITMETAMEGLPIAMPPMTTTMTQCVTKDDLVPKSADKNQECVVKEQKISGNKVAWKVVCEGKDGRSEGEGQVTYAGDSYKGNMKMKVTSKDGQTMTANAALKGRRLGACTAEKKAEYAKRKAQAEERNAELAARGRQAEAEYKATMKQQDERTRRAEEIVSLKVPTADGNACALGDWKLDGNPECDRRFGKLDIAPGVWEQTTEGATRVDDGEIKTYLLAEDSRREVSISATAGLLDHIERSCETKDVRRSGNKITWNFKCASPYDGGSREGSGGIVVSRTGYTAVLRTLIVFGPKVGARSQVTVSKITGRLLREEAARDGRDYTSTQRKSTESPAESGTGNVIRNIRKRFGF